MELSSYFCPCPRGLEVALVEDIVAAGGRDARAVPGGAMFSGDWESCYRMNLGSRIATRILWRVGSGNYRSEDDVFRIAGRLDWPAWFSVDRTLRVYVTAVKSPLKSIEFVTLRIKDAICDRFRGVSDGRRPSVDTAHPEMRIHAFLTADQVTLYLDTSGEPLYIRGHKHAKVQAPLKENLAAGILRLAGWTPGTPLLDPMCGSGTFLLEAAQVSLDIAPGLSRPADGFALTRLRNFDAALWRRLRAEAQSRRAAPRMLPLFGSDVEADAVARTQQNLAVAGLDGVATVVQADALERAAPAESGILIANPPYGERIGEAEELAAFYPRLGDALKARFAGWDCYLLSADTRLPKLIGLKVDHRTPLFNGALDCRLYHFRMVAGSRRARGVETVPD
jgi:putative N6-adenine-specific DNA methylase